MKQLFLVMDRDGTLVSKENTPEGAREVARDYVGDTGLVEDQTGGATSADIADGQQELRNNPVEFVKKVKKGGWWEEHRESLEPDPRIILSKEDGQKAVQGRIRSGPKAKEITHLPFVDLDEVMKLTKDLTNMKETYNRLRPYLVGTSGMHYSHFLKPHTLLASNFKMSKAGAAKERNEERDLGFNEEWTRVGKVFGVSVLPYWQAPAIVNALYKRFGKDVAPGRLFGSQPKNGKLLGKTRKVRVPWNKDPISMGLPVVYDLMNSKGFFQRFSAIRRDSDMAAHCKLWMPKGLVDEDGKRLKDWPRNFSMCPASSAACRCACLTSSGQQLANGTANKIANTIALLEDPVAFYAWLLYSCRTFFDGVRSPEAFVRLNVMSDIPHEIVFPGLFEICKPHPKNIKSRYPLVRRSRDGREKGECEFYDYSAVTPVGRMLPVNYDITMSFKGDNWTECMEALEAGYRVAMVFVSTDKDAGWNWNTRLPGFPKEIRGITVKDGDSDDMRPLDDGEIICGLKYKMPKNTPEEAIYFQRFRSGFIIPVVEYEGALIAVETPSQSGADWYATEAELVGLQQMAEEPMYWDDSRDFPPERVGEYGSELEDD